MRKKEKHKVYILIPIFNGVNETIRCLKSIYKSTYTNFEVVIIDDGSTDNSQNIINDNFNNITFINGDGNLWWSGGINEGLRYVLDKQNESDLIVLLNNDNIIKEDMIENLVESVNKYPNSIICSKVYIDGRDNTILFAGGYASVSKSGLYINGYYNRDKAEFNELSKVDWCGGMGVAIPLSIIKKVGYFDNKNFPQYFGDADFMYRVRRKGFKIIYDPSCICWNNKEQTGFSINDERVTFNKIKKLLFNIKSNYDLKSNISFYFKHFGCIRGTSMLIMKYTILFLSLFKKVVLSNF
ncbi:glycosyltransferase family 2 protein [Bacillus sp. AFS031507]|uniref:glycosyltransferase family 2 protein n=1 Tax=Bacillus sp. AFS031507 TaxID=2033496 RepID=UPI0015D4DA01|nr:glycosyltransferase family 2 protein [Bacillus sp. AFS031507]